MDTIVVLGSINYDILFRVDRLPAPGETYPARSVAFEGGGKGANQAVQAALLGANVELIGAVGTDALGTELLDRLRSAGVGVSHIARVDTPTGVGVVSFLDDGSVSATIGRGANFAIPSAPVERATDLYTDDTVALFQLETPPELVAVLARSASRAGATVILNAAPACRVPDALSAAVDILVVNEVESAWYLGLDQPVGPHNVTTAGKRLQETFGASVVITLGAQGSYVFDAERLDDGVYLPALPVAAIETTGAGDSYVGAMAVCLAQGGTLREAAEFGTLASSVTVQGVGAQAAMPDITTIKT